MKDIEDDVIDQVNKMEERITKMFDTVSERAEDLSLHLKALETRFDTLEQSLISKVHINLDKKLSVAEDKLVKLERIIAQINDVEEELGETLTKRQLHKIIKQEAI